MWVSVLIHMYIWIYVLIESKEAQAYTAPHNIETIKLVSHLFKLTLDEKNLQMYTDVSVFTNVPSLAHSFLL